MGKAKDIIDWAVEHGEPRIIDRLRLRVFPSLMRERLVLTQVNASTRCSEALLAELRAAASDLVGRPCPF